MSSLIDDGSLVGFWPLLEPSGEAFFKNYSPAYAQYPSGISFDMHVSTAELQNKEERSSFWPGSTVVNNTGSGNVIRGYRVPGKWKVGTDSSPESHYLTLGGGGRTQVEQCLGPSVAQSGFTAGLWIFPNSDGYLLASEDAFNLSAANTWSVAYARAHTLLGQFNAFNNNAGWYIGASGSRDRGAGTELGLEAGNTLGAFVSMTKGNNSTPDLLLETPIEANRYTHITITYRYIDGNSNELVLYKDGRVTASGTTNDDITLANSTLISSSQHRPLSVGASDNEASTVNVNHYDATSGWGNLVSGVYHFRRVLHEGEVLDLHNCGGLQPDESVILPTDEFTITDNNLCAYYPLMEPGFADVSRNHRPLISNFDMGDVGIHALLTTGPHRGGLAYQDGVSSYVTHAANSGLCEDLLSTGSWTIATNVAGTNTSSRNTQMMFSWGSVTSVTNGTTFPSTSPPTDETAGICCSVSGTTGQQRYIIEVYSTGDVTDTDNILVFNIDGFKEYYDGSVAHLALAYDDNTKGIVAYLNGVSQGSGVFTHSLTDHLSRITSSGYPLLFQNGVQDTITETSSQRGLHAAGGQDTSIGPIFLAKRALLPSEVRYVASSGIDITRLHNTHHDPRLMGYWPASDFKIDDVVVGDLARCWKEVTGNLVRGDTFAKQERWYDKDHNEAAGTIFDNQGIARYNHFGFRTLPPELESFGNLGITSGTFGVRSGSLGTANITDADNARSSIGNLSSRYLPCIEERDLVSQNPAEYILSYEVTPSGDIPATLLGYTSTTSPNFNCTLHINGFDGTGSRDIRSYLTTIEAGSGSGVSLVWRGENDTPLVSGNVPYGVPTRMLFHSKFELPNYLNDFNAGAAPYTVSLWLDGELVQRRQLTAATAQLWSDQTPDGTTSSKTLQFGGLISHATTYTNEFASTESGLGDIYLRNIFVMRGIFGKDEVAALASSGIQTRDINGFTNNQGNTQVTIGDANLVGYYRFNGFDGGGSGTTDISLNSNHLYPLQENLANEGTNSLGAFNVRAFPGPFEASDLGVHCSGFTYSSVAPTSTSPHNLPMFMASGAGFNSPDTSFSVGFFYITKLEVGLNEFRCPVAYGTVPDSTSDTTTDVNRGWAIGQQENELFFMIISLDGNMYIDNVNGAHQAGQLVIGAFGEGSPIFDDLTQWEQYRLGQHRLPRMDAWAHHCWVYDSTVRQVRYYVNGDIIDQKYMKEGKDPQIPAEAARYLTFLQHTTDPWENASPVVFDHEGSLTDFFYFQDALTDAEVRYIAQNGIDAQEGTPTSGIIGGFVHGQDAASGIIGGYHRGQDTMSGIIGGFIPGGALASGIIGGFVSGVEFGTGTIGGWIQGLGTMSGIMGGLMRGGDIGSGMIAGYIHGQEIGSGIIGGLMLGAVTASGLIGGQILGSQLASGVIGGFMLGGLEGTLQFDAGYTIEVMAAEDFDAEIEIAKTADADFDAKVIIFQDELPPLVEIIIPGSTVTGQAPPFNQYFIGKASGQQDKTISETRWTFGDLTPPVSVSESGAGCYPVQHYYATSGFYIAKFEAIDSDGIHNSATRIINAASGIDPTIITLSGVPRSGTAELIVDFTTNVDILPPGVIISSKLLLFDDGQSSISFNPTHAYVEPGIFKPVWCVRDSRGFFWCDSLEAGNDLLES
jgi:hypothetical protein